MAAGYAPYVMSVAKELPASVQFGSVTTVAGYRVTTPENERNALGYFPNAVTGGLGGEMVSRTRNMTEASIVGLGAAYTNQVISSQGEVLSVKPSHVVNGLAYGTGKYLGGYNCGDACQTSIIVVPNTAFGKVSDELFNTVFHLMKYKGILKMNKDSIYDFVIDNKFICRMNRAFLMIVIWLIFISLFSYYIFTSNVWTIEIFGIKVSTFYLAPVIGIIPTLHE